MRNTLICLFLFCFWPALNAQTADLGGMQVATVTLSAAQLISLHNTPAPLIAAPGAGKMLAPFSAVFQYKAGATPYGVAPDSHVLLYVGQTLNNVTRANAIRFLDQASSQVFMVEGIGGVGISPQSTLENAPLMAQNDSPAEWTSGDGTVTITVYYTVVSLQ